MFSACGNGDYDCDILILRSKGEQLTLQRKILKYIVIGILSVVYFYLNYKLTIYELNGLNVFQRLADYCVFSLVPMGGFVLV